MKLAVVLPVGPDHEAADTVDSVFVYATRDVRIFAIDDSRNQQRGDFSKAWTPHHCSYPAGERYTFDTLLRIDTDALIIGRNPEEDAHRYFNAHPETGMLGSYRRDCNDEPRDFAGVRSRLQAESGVRGLRNIRRRWVLRQWMKRARRFNYEPGEHTLGGAVFVSAACVSAMYESGFLQTDVFKESLLSEDHLFGLITVACGYRLADFATGDWPMGLRWRGLPDSPENLIRRHKKIVHSVRYWQNLNEDDIRQYFRELRQAERGRESR